MNQIAKTMVFGSTVSTLLQEMVQFSQRMVFNSNLPKGTVQADTRAFIHHKYFKSHMTSSLFHKRGTEHICMEPHNKKKNHGGTCLNHMVTQSTYT
jgi:hypothetical protein